MNCFARMKWNSLFDRAWVPVTMAFPQGTPKKRSSPKAKLKDLTRLEPKVSRIHLCHCSQLAAVLPSATMMYSGLKSGIDCCINSLYLGTGMSGNNKLFRLGCSFSPLRMIASWFGANACQSRLTSFKTKKNLTLIPHWRMILNIKKNIFSLFSKSYMMSLPF